MSQSQLIVMLKAPVAGRVKTRLAEAIGPDAACLAYRQLVETLFARLADAGPISVHYAPGDTPTEKVMRAWLGDGYRYVPQSNGDLGARMQSAVETAFAKGARTAILLGGDCPYIDQMRVREVERRLERYDAVIGPSVDGGYYLLGLRRPTPCLFQGIPWSTETVLKTTLARAENAGLSVALLDLLEDVDDVASWKRTQGVLLSDKAAPTNPIA